MPRCPVPGVPAPAPFPAGPAAGEGVDVRGGQVVHVVHAGGAEFHGQPDAGALAELVAVDAQPQPGVLAGLQHAAGLVLVEGAPLAKDVGPADVGPDRGEHRPADQVRVGLRVRPGRHQVRPEVGHLVRHRGGDPGAAGLVLDVQAVAGLGFQVGGALRHGLGDPAHRQPGEVEVARAPGGARGDGDPAGAVALPRHPGLELGGPVPGEDQVRVRVHPARQQRPAAGVHGVVGGRARPAAGPSQEIRSPSITTAASGGRGGPVLGHQLGDIGDQGAHGSILQRRMDQRVAASASAVRDAGLRRPGRVAGRSPGRRGSARRPVRRCRRRSGSRSRPGRRARRIRGPRRRTPPPGRRRPPRSAGPSRPCGRRGSRAW